MLNKTVVIDAIINDLYQICLHNSLQEEAIEIAATLAKVRLRGLTYNGGVANPDLVLLMVSQIFNSSKMPKGRFWAVFIAH
jgi:hypothetical protein